MVGGVQIEEGELITGWGRATASRSTLVTPETDEDWAAVFDTAGTRGVIARGGHGDLHEPGRGGEPRRPAPP